MLWVGLKKFVRWLTVESMSTGVDGGVSSNNLTLVCSSADSGLQSKSVVDSFADIVSALAEDPTCKWMGVKLA